MALTSLKAIQALWVDDRNSDAYVLSQLQSLDAPLLDKLERSCLMSQTLRDAMCNRMQQACQAISESLNWADTTLSMALLRWLLVLVPPEVGPKTAANVLYNSQLVQCLSGCLHTLCTICSQVGPTKPDVHGLAGSLLQAIQDICLWSFPVVASGSQTASQAAGGAWRSGADTAGAALVPALLDLIALLTKFPAAYVIRREAVGCMLELAASKRNIQLLLGPSMQPAMQALLTDTLPTCGDHATQVDLLELLYRCCRVNADFCKQFFNHHETLQCFQALLAKDSRTVDLLEEMRLLLVLYNGSRGKQASVMSLPAEAITTDNAQLQVASTDVDFGHGHFSILMRASSPSSEDQQEEQDAADACTDILDVDLAGVVRVTVMPAKGKPHLQQAQVELVPPNAAGQEGQEPTCRPCMLTITFNDNLMTRFSTILQRQGCNIVQHSNGLFELSQPLNQAKARMSKGIMPNSYRRGPAPSCSGVTPATSNRIGQLVFRKSTTVGSGLRTGPLELAPVDSTAAAADPEAPLTDAAGGRATKNQPVPPTHKKPPVPPQAQKAFARAAKGKAAMAAVTNEAIEDADLATLPSMLAASGRKSAQQGSSQQERLPTRSQQERLPTRSQQHSRKQTEAAHQDAADAAPQQDPPANIPPTLDLEVGTFFEQQQMQLTNAGDLPPSPAPPAGSPDAAMQASPTDPDQHQLLLPPGQLPAEEGSPQLTEPGFPCMLAQPVPESPAKQSSMVLQAVSDLLHSPDPDTAAADAANTAQEPVDHNIRPPATAGIPAADAGNLRSQQHAGPEHNQDEEPGAAATDLVARTPAPALLATPARGRLGGMQSNSAAKHKAASRAPCGKEGQPAEQAQPAALPPLGPAANSKKGRQPRGKQAAAAPGVRKAPTKRAAAGKGKAGKRGGSGAAAADTDDTTQADAAADPYDIPDDAAGAAAAAASAAADKAGGASGRAAAGAATASAKQHAKNSSKQLPVPSSGAQTSSKLLSQEQDKGQVPGRRSMRASKAKALQSMKQQLQDTQRTSPAAGANSSSTGAGLSGGYADDPDQAVPPLLPALGTKPTASNKPAGSVKTAAVKPAQAASNPRQAASAPTRLPQAPVLPLGCPAQSMQQPKQPFAQAAAAASHPTSRQTDTRKHVALPPPQAAEPAHTQQSPALSDADTGTRAGKARTAGGHTAAATLSRAKEDVEEVESPGDTSAATPPDMLEPATKVNKQLIFSAPTARGLPPRPPPLALLTKPSAAVPMPASPAEASSPEVAAAAAEPHLLYRSEQLHAHKPGSVLLGLPPLGLGAAVAPPTPEGASSPDETAPPVRRAAPMGLAVTSGGLLQLGHNKQQRKRAGATATDDCGKVAKRARAAAEQEQVDAGGDADLQLVIGMLTRSLKDDEDGEGSDGDDVELLQAALLRTMSKRRGKAQHNAQALLKELEQQVSGQVQQLHDACQAERAKLLAATRSQHQQLTQALEIKAAAVQAVQQRFNADLQAAWSEYKEVYGRLASLDEATNATVAQQQERLRRKMSNLQQQAAGMMEEAAAKLATLQQQATKLPGLASMLQGAL